MPRRRDLAAVLALLPILWLAAAPARGGDAVSTRIEFTLDEVGDADMILAARHDGEAEYRRDKAACADPATAARRAARGNVKTAIRDAAVTAPDGVRTLRLSARILGAAILRRDRWEMGLDAPYRLIHASGRTVVLAHSSAAPSGKPVSEILKITLPPGAGDPSHDRSRRILSYRLPRIPRRDGPADLARELETRRAIMSSLPKIHSQPEILHGAMWVARTVLHNRGGCDITDIRLRYRVDGLSSWSSDVRYDLLPPGGTLVDCHYPIFEPGALDTPSPVPVEVEARVSYRDGDGVRREDALRRRLTLLARRQFELGPVVRSDAADWTGRHLYAPLLGGYITPADPAIREFAAAARGPEGTPLDDDEAIRFCNAVYARLLEDSTGCRDPAGFLSGDPVGVIEVKFPRETLRERGGTSLDMALLFASVCEAGGLESGLGLVPGACFALVRLPGGDTLPLCFANPASDGGLETLDAAYAAGRRACAAAPPEEMILAGPREARRLDAAPPAETPRTR